MADRRPNKKKTFVKKANEKQLRRERDANELKELATRVAAFAPKDASKFDDLPISKNTAIGLKQSHFTTLTDIQKVAIPSALKGRDILGAAKTGSGKTIAFLVPLLEILYRNQWTQYDGLGALVVSPTRELAIQIFDVLRKIGRAHSFSAGLVIGGKDVQVERDRISRLNILVCTPGRILQHMDQAAGFETGNLKMLVLDEADRILDMGFRKTIDAIVQHLPKERQTLLFSATQTQTVSDLARLSLSPKTAEYISAHEESTASTPSGLLQYYVISPLPEKLDTLFGFVKTHLKAKILVFASSSKQVRFLFETFKTLHPGIPLMHLHGRQKQAARIDVTDRFSESKNACLFCTDIAARGLDFPAIDWVVQLDAPEDADTYIHRVGRTARFESTGRSLLMLTLSESEGMLARLAAKKVPIEKITIKESKKRTIKTDLQALCFKSPEIKYLGQKAFVSYCRSVFIQKDREIFKFDDIPFEEYAQSLGLPGTPQIKFQTKNQAKQRKNASQSAVSDDDESGHDMKAKAEVRTKYDRMFERQNQNVLSNHYMNMIQDEKAGGEEDDDGFMAIKRHNHKLSDDSDSDSTDEKNLQEPGFKPVLPIGIEDGPVSRRQAKAALSKKAMLKHKSNPTKLLFDDDGNSHALYEFEQEEDFNKHGKAEDQKAEFLSKEEVRMQEIDVLDKEVARSKRKEAKRRQKERLERELAGENSESEEGVEEIEEEAPVQKDRGKRKKWFEEEGKTKRAKTQEMEIAQPTTLDDLESLTLRLMSANK
ncbi:P-loop containing nucleoside triphosphate hydrolase protein [Lipomyces arxii]|uniref:P-loop containing nucleoside triphosphate hydrolase protein n=1 Tax=Lipomyces arxii TaxID=56418 RepID=UPI0034CE9D32